MCMYVCTSCTSVYVCMCVCMYVSVCICGVYIRSEYIGTVNVPLKLDIIMIVVVTLWSCYPYSLDWDNTINTSLSFSSVHSSVTPSVLVIVLCNHMNGYFIWLPVMEI